MSKLKPVHIDGVLYGLIALCGYLAGALGGDSAAALFTSMSLWLLQTLNGCILATATALKMFRSTTYAKHQDDTVNGHGDVVQKKESQEITIAPDQSVQKVTKTEAVVETKAAPAVVALLLLMLMPLSAQAQRFPRVVNTLAEMVASNPNVVETNVFVADPKRGGLFSWTAGSAIGTNAGTILPSTYPGASGRYFRQFTDGVYNVAWFGALGNGAIQTNETAAALAAIPSNAGGTLLFPPGNYRINLNVANRKNVHILFDSFVREDAGIPVIVSNIVTAADSSRPIITIGDNTNFSRGIVIEGGTFTGNGTNTVLLRLQGGAYECVVKNAGFYNGITNIWVQGEGAVPCAINRFENLSIQAANVNNSRAVYVASPTTGIGYTTTSGFSGCHFNSQVPGVNTYTFQLDSTDVEMQNSRFDTLQNAPNRFSMTGGLINPQPAVMTCANVIFDGSSISPSAYADYAASPRISALVQGSYLWNGQANINGLILQEDKCQSSVGPGGQYFSMFINGAAAFDRIGGTTNRTWNRAEVSDDDPTIFMLMATNGTMQVIGRTNISFATGDGSATNRILYVQPGQVIVTNSQMNLTSFGVYGAGSGLYSDTNNPTARIFTSAQTNTVRSALHLDSYQNTPAFPISLDFGLMNSTNGAFTSRLVHFGNVNTNQGSELLIQTHTTSNGLWNTGMKLMNNGWFGFGLTNPASFVDIAGDTMIRGTNFGVRGIPYAWPAASAAGTLQNNGAGVLSWAASGGGGATNAYNQVQWNGTNIAQETIINFQGLAVSNIVDSGGVTVITLDKGTGSSTTGTVTSVGLTMPSTFAVSGSPVTTSGTLAVTATGSQPYYFLSGNFGGETVWDNSLYYSNADNTISAVYGAVKRGRVGSATNSPASGGILGQYRTGGWNQSGYFLGAGWRGDATENWTPTANGSKLTFFTVASGTAVTTDRFIIDQNGDILVGSTNLIGALAGKEPLFTTGLGITNVANVLSNNIVAGSNVTITGGANGQLTIAATGGGASDNWVASGSTNSTLPGIGSTYGLVVTNTATFNGDLLIGSTNAAGAIAGKQPIFTTGAGVTNISTVLSANLAAGSNITFTTNSNGQISIASSGGGSGTTNGLEGWQLVGAGTDWQFSAQNTYQKIVFGTTGPSIVLTNAGKYQIAYDVAAYAANTTQHDFYVTNVTDSAYVAGTQHGVNVSSGEHLTPIIFQITTAGANRSLELWGQTHDATYTSSYVLATNTIVTVVYLGNSSGAGSDNWTASGTTNSTLPGIASVNGIVVTNTATFNGDTSVGSTNIAGAIAAKVTGAASSTDLAFARWSGTGGKTLQDSSVTWNGNATKLGADAASPTAQTIIASGPRGGTDSNTAGANMTVAGSPGTGTGAGGSLLFATSPAGSTGSATNASVTALTIASTGVATFGFQISDSYASVASTPAEIFTGTWFSGGSATTTKPHVLIEPTGTTSTGWSTAGTGLGINLASGSTANAIDTQLSGVSKFSVASSGNVTSAGNITSAAATSTAAASGFRFTSSSQMIAPSDGSILFRNSGGTGFTTFQLGPDDATPDTTVTLRAANGVGTDKVGGGLQVDAGAGTGTGVGGAWIARTSITNTTGSTAQSMTTRCYRYASDASLTESSASSVVKLTIAAKKFVSVKMFASTHADDNTDFQVTTDNFVVSCVAKGTAVTSQISTVQTSTACSAGTLTTTWTVLDNGDNTFTLQNNAVSSLTQVRLKTAWQIEVNSDDVATVSTF